MTRAKRIAKKIYLDERQIAYLAYQSRIRGMSESAVIRNMIEGHAEDNLWSWDGDDEKLKAWIKSLRTL